MGTVIIRWQDRSIEETEQRIYRSTSPFDKTNLPPVLATVAPNVQEYKDTTVIEGINYYYIVSSYRAEPELEVFSDTIEVNTNFSLGPGPSELIGGTAEMGFFGEIPVTELINGEDLAAAVGLTAGSPTDSNEPWLKFVLDGQIMYVAKKPLRHTISWQSIYQAGLVYGVDGPGLFPDPEDQPVNQLKLVEINGYQFTVRLLKGTDEDPSNVPGSVDDAEGTWNSEWARLMYPICTTNVPSYTGPKYANYTDVDLGASSNGYGWLQETWESNKDMRRGVGSRTAISYGTWEGRSNTNSAGWRPVLVLNV